MPALLRALCCQLFRVVEGLLSQAVHNGIGALSSLMAGMITLFWLRLRAVEFFQLHALVSALCESICMEKEVEHDMEQSDFQNESSNILFMHYRHLEVLKQSASIRSAVWMHGKWQDSLSIV